MSDKAADSGLATDLESGVEDVFTTDPSDGLNEESTEPEQTSAPTPDSPSNVRPTLFAGFQSTVDSLPAQSTQPDGDAFSSSGAGQSEYHDDGEHMSEETSLQARKEHIRLSKLQKLSGIVGTKVKCPPETVLKLWTDTDTLNEEISEAEKTGFLKYFKASYDLRNIPGEGTLNPWESACLEVGFPAEDISRVEMDGFQALRDSNLIEEMDRLVPSEAQIRQAHVNGGYYFN